MFVTRWRLCLAAQALSALYNSADAAAITSPDSAASTAISQPAATGVPADGIVIGPGGPDTTVLSINALTLALPVAATPTAPLFPGQPIGLPTVIPLPSSLPVDNPIAKFLNILDGTSIVYQNDTQLPVTPADVHSLEVDYIAQNYSSTPADTKVKARAGTLRVLAIGDSITQGAEGDWTWRWRIWEWFRDNGVAMQFVGPYAGPQAGVVAAPPPVPSPAGSAADPNFGALNINGKYAKTDGFGHAASMDDKLAHFSIWGRTIGYDIGLIGDVVKNAQPDLIIMLLGYNDLAWTGTAVTAEDVIRRMDEFLRNVRAAAPNVKIAMGNAPQPTWFGQQIIVDKINEFNSKLAPTIQQVWNTPQSPVYLADVRGHYSCNAISCPAGYDGLHPDAQGEFEIAVAFSKTLYNNFKLGKGPLAMPNPIPQRDMGSIQGLSVVSSGRGVTATWTPIFGAYSYDIETTINDGAVSAGQVVGARWDTTWPFDGAKYGFRVRASSGKFDYLKSAWSPWQYATATPKLAGPPNNIKTYPTNDGALVIMDPATGPNIDSIIIYQVIWWDLDAHCAFVAGTPFKPQGAGATYTLSGFPTGDRLLIAPASWNANGLGFPNFGRYVRTGVRGAGVATPASLNIVNRNNGTSQFTFSAVSGSAGYVLWSRNVYEGNTTYQPTLLDMTCLDAVIYYPGVWNYEYCISSYNGDDTSPTKARCTQIAAPADNPSPPPACPAPSPWCPEFYGGGPAPAATNTGYPGPATTPVGGLGSNGGGSGSTTVIGGTTTVVSGTTTVVGGSTSVIPPSSTTTTSTPGSLYWPTCNAKCTGPDCYNGACTGPLCVCFGCSGNGCYNGACTGTECISFGCIGSNCVNGVCKGAGCETNGCIGSGCGSDGKTHGSNSGGDSHCHGINCISVGCAGISCSGGGGGGTGICSGPSCSKITCTGADCVNGGCVGPNCLTYDTSPGGDPAAPQSNPNPSCSAGTSVATTCTVTYNSRATPTTTTNCFTTTGCGVKGTTKTTTISGTGVVYGFATWTVDLLNPTSDAYVRSVLAVKTNSDSSRARSASMASTTTKATITTTAKPTASSPLIATPLPKSSGGQWQVNLYADTACSDFVAGARYTDIGNKCVAFPRPVNSYQFVVKGEPCNLDNRAYVVAFIGSKSGCDAGSGTGGGCGDDQTCQKMSFGAGLAITSNNVQGGGGKRSLDEVFGVGNWTMY